MTPHPLCALPGIESREVHTTLLARRVQFWGVGREKCTRTGASLCAPLGAQSREVHTKWVEWVVATPDMDRVAWGGGADISADGRTKES